MASAHCIGLPSAHESVRQLLGHSEIKATTRFYAGPNTRRAGRAHADLIRKLREPQIGPRKRNGDPDLGMALMGKSKISAKTTISMADAVRYRDGLMIALLAQVPLRPKNAAALQIGRDVVKEGVNWSIVIPPYDTKTRTYLDFEIPESVRDYFAAYLTLVRPRMLRRSGCSALWVSPKGGPLSHSALWAVFARHTIQRLGIRITPHDVRDAAATTWAIAAPDRVGISRDLLGHADLRTTNKHYNAQKG